MDEKKKHKLILENDNGKDHTGHRKRIYKRYVDGDTTLDDQNLLELLLFAVQKRADTWYIAGDLIKEFDGIKDVFGGDIDTLLTVKGMGENTAAYLTMLGQFFSKNLSATAKQKGRWGINLANSLPHLFEILGKDDPEDKFGLFFFDNNELLLGSVLGKDTSPVDVNEAVRAIHKLHPCGAMYVHYKSQGTVYYNDYDDELLRKAYYVLNTNDVKLFDYLILSGDTYYSYYFDDMLSPTISSLADLLNDFSL